jgi:2'-5' RNA ligase
MTEAADWHRCFVALVPDIATRDAFSAMPVGASVRRVPADQLHMTLAFLGSIPEDKGALVAAALSSVVVPLPALDGARLEYWPSRAHPRLAVLAFQPSDALAELEGRVRSLVSGVDLPIDDHRPFRPHVTLARLPRDAKPIVLDQKGGSVSEAHRNSDSSFEGSRFDRLTLYSSTLARRGARYRSLVSVPVPALSMD